MTNKPFASIWAWSGGLGTLAAFLLFACAVSPAQVGTNPTANQTEPAALPKIEGPLVETATSHAFLASSDLKQPLNLEKVGYEEEEYLVSGEARVFDWPESAGAGPKVLAQGPYTTRILVRRPRDDRRFNGTAIVEPLNPSTPVDLPIMWAESYAQIIADGYAWVGVTIKPDTIKSLKRFDPARYAALSMPHPPSGPTCSVADINPWSQPTTPADETGLAWDMLSQIGALLKSNAGGNPLSRPAERLYMTGQSQTADYSRTYASVFGRIVTGPNGKPLYDGYLYAGSPSWQVPLHQCFKGFSPGDPRLITGAAGSPIIEIVTQGDMVVNVESRRPDSDQAPDLFRRYEVAGASHEDPWEDLSIASTADLIRATGQSAAEVQEEVAYPTSCEPKDAGPADFPVRYVFDAAWRNLDNWVRNGVAAPHGAPLELKPRHLSQAQSLSAGLGGNLCCNQGSFLPALAFVTDAYGNAEGGVRTPYVDVPTVSWIGPKAGVLECMLEVHKYPLKEPELQRLYSTHEAYVAKVRASVEALEAQHWLTPEDGAAIVQEARELKVP